MTSKTKKRIIAKTNLVGQKIKRKGKIFTALNGVAFSVDPITADL